MQLSVTRSKAGTRSSAGAKGTERRGPDRSVVTAALATTVAAFGLVVLGSTVRVTSSGMGCPSWPLCFGHVGPVDQYHALLEQSHRYLASLVTVGAITTAVLARRSRVRRRASVPAMVAAGLVLFQAALGAVTVFARNEPWTVAVHLVVGLVFLASTVVTATAALRAPRWCWSSGEVGRWAPVLVASTLLTIVGGSVVVATGAATRCPSWPLCPSSAPGLADWQLVHRGLAGCVGLALVAFVGTHWRRTAGEGSWRALAVASLGSYAAVAAFGAASALTRAAADWQDVHLAAVAFLWVLVVTLVTSRSLRGAPGPAPAGGQVAPSRP